MKRRTFLGLAATSACQSTREAGIRIATAQATLGHTPPAVAAELGFFRAQGLPVAIEEIANPSKTVEALLAGSVDAAVAPYESVLLLRAKGQSVRAFVNLVHRDIRAVACLPGSKAIRSIRDLAGKTIGVSGIGSGTHFFLNHVLALNGMSPSDVSTTGTGMGAPAITALLRGVVDASVVAAGDLLRIKIRYPQMILLNDTSSEEGSQAVYGVRTIPTVSLMARPEWLESHPDDARKAAAAILQALQWIHGHSPAEIRERMPPAALSPDAAEDGKVLGAMKEFWSRDGIILAAGAEALYRALRGTHDQIALAKIDLASTFTNEFVRENG